MSVASAMTSLSDALPSDWVTINTFWVFLNFTSILCSSFCWRLCVTVKWSTDLCRWMWVLVVLHVTVLFDNSTHSSLLLFKKIKKIWNWWWAQCLVVWLLRSSDANIYFLKQSRFLSLTKYRKTKSEHSSYSVLVIFYSYYTFLIIVRLQSDPLHYRCWLCITNNALRC